LAEVLSIWPKEFNFNRISSCSKRHRFFAGDLSDAESRTDSRHDHLNQLLDPE